MKAHDRDIGDWCGKIQRAEIKLPRFQRFEAWDRNRICSLVSAIIQEPSLPLGITLIMEVSGKEKFVSRHLETAEPPLNEDGRVLEHLLDGQQRLTALWRVFHNNYETETYYVYIKKFDIGKQTLLRDYEACYVSRYYKPNGNRYPLWCDEPAKTLSSGLIPTDLLNPLKSQGGIDSWVNKAVGPMPEKPEDLHKFYQRKENLNNEIKDLRHKAQRYNLPYLALPSSTDRGIALEVFINMNTNSKPLSPYDIIVAQMEQATGMSLHELQENLQGHEMVVHYGDLSRLILNTSALLQGKLPNKRGAFDMDAKTVVDNWRHLEKGVRRMATFLKNEKIYDAQRLPTNAVLAVIAALYRHIPESGDEQGKYERLLKKYLWSSFITDRYENAAATNAFGDFNALRDIMLGNHPFKSAEETVPVFKRPLQLDYETHLQGVEWPKRATILGRAVLAVACRCEAQDFATGEALTSDNIGKRHYHHIFPDALLKEAGIDSYNALNCALIADKTNYIIGADEPLQYLRERAEHSSVDIVRDRLHSHLIPYEELSCAGGYDSLGEEQKRQRITSDFESFLSARAKLIVCAAEMLASGQSISASEVFRKCKNDSE